LNTFLLLLTAQTYTTLFLAMVLWSLYARLRRQEFTRWWAWAWTSSAVCLALGRTVLTLDTESILLRGGVMLAAMLSGFLAVPLLAFGAFSFRSPHVISRRVALTGLGGAFVLGTIVFFVSMLWADPIASFSIRQGARTTALGTVLLFCAWVFLSRVRETRSWAVAITGGCCLVLSLAQFFYAARLFRVASAIASGGLPDGTLLRLANLLSVEVAITGGICLGMILLLVEEHQRAEQALFESVHRARVVAEENAVLQAEIAKRQVVERELRDSDGALRRSEEKFATAFRSSPCAMTITSLEEGQFIDVNRSFERQTGYSKAEVLGRTSLELGLWPNKADRTAYYGDMRDQGTSAEREVELITKSGRTMWAVMSAETITVGGQRCVLSVGVDVTARREAEARHEAIVKALPDWIFLMNKDGVFLEFHARDQRHLLVPAEQFIGHKVIDVLPGELGARLTNCFAEALQSDHLVTLEYSLPIGEGLRFYEVRAVRSEGERVLALVRDMTDQTRAEYRARELQDELAHVGRVMALGTLTGALAHEINQPLAAIGANAHTALRMLDAPQPDVKEVSAALGDIMSDSRRIDEVLRHLRSLLKKERREYAEVDVNSLVAEVLALAHSDVVRRQITLDVVLAPELATVFGDRIQLQQVVLNLLMNACEAVGSVDVSQRHVSLTTRAENGLIVVSVSDRGIGIPDEQLDRMFEPFYTTTSDGMGLGLSICRAIIDSHGGRLSAQRNPDSGLTCWFSLAALPKTGATPAEPPARTVRIGTWT
jgi:PAS domain S-box-containing protein